MKKFNIIKAALFLLLITGSILIVRQVLIQYYLKDENSIQISAKIVSVKKNYQENYRTANLGSSGNYTYHITYEYIVGNKIYSSSTSKAPSWISIDFPNNYGINNSIPIRYSKKHPKIHKICY